MANAQTSDEPPRFLLLLPAASTPTWEAYRGEFGETVQQVLKEVALASEAHPKAAILDIALACPHLVALDGSRAFSHYDETQKVVALAYRLVCVIATRDSINVEDADGVDVCLLLVAWDGSASVPDSPVLQGPVVSLPQLAASQRPWQYAFGVENDKGEGMVRAFVQAKTEQQSVTANPPPASGHAPKIGQDESAEIQHSCVAVGGTFDHLHIGHKLLLTLTLFAAADKTVTDKRNRSVIVGITGDELLKNKKFADQLESWHSRQKAVSEFIQGIVHFSPPDADAPSSAEVSRPGPNGHAVDITFPSGLLVRCVEIADPFGPTITEEAIDALIISAETRSGGKAVNDKRVERGWAALEVLEVDVLDAVDDGSSEAAGGDRADFAGKISSTEIRKKLSEKAASTSNPAL